MSQYLVTGANRGIGLKFAERLLERGEDVLATCRNPATADELNALGEAGKGKLEVLELDVSREDSLQRFADDLRGRPIDVLINNAGVYGPRDGVFGNVQGDDWAAVLQVNAIAPILLTQAIIDSLRQGQDKKLVYITSKMGSIEDNSGGGQYIYRSSKAALNAACKSLAIDLSVDGFKVAILHPGWVRTDMGGPNGLIDSDASVYGMLDLIDALNEKSSGRFVAYDGKEIPW